MGGRTLLASGLGYRTLAMHWDGVGWSIVPSPDPAANSDELSDVVATAPDDAWAVGHMIVGFGVPSLMIRWDGFSWAVVSSPSPRLAVNQLIDVDAFGPDDVWVVGRKTDVMPPVGDALVLHWDGTLWTEIAAPAPGEDSMLEAVDAAPDGELWAVGVWSRPGESGRSLVLRGCGL